jgi:ketosteroid isomerase-like protein
MRTNLVIGAFALAVSGCHASDRSVAEEARAATVRQFAEAYNEQRKGWFEDFHAPIYRWEGLGPWAPAGNRLGYDQMVQMVEEEVRHFPDRRMEIRRLVVDGDQVAVHYEWSGTAAMDMGGMRKGEVQRWHNLLFVTVRDGKMVEAYEYGVLPAGAAASPGQVP